MGWDMCSPQYFVQVFFKAHELEICRLMIGNKHFLKNQRIQMCYFTYLYKGGGHGQMTCVLTLLKISFFTFYASANVRFFLI